jgi:uncharacterized repeat protein (TIGR01451 family)
MKTGNIVKITAIFLMCALGLLAVAAPAAHASATGYSEYYIPGNENAMALALKRYGTSAPSTDNTHVIISITAWSDDVTVYYDHWENGFGFDPANPATTADETFTTLANAGDTLTLDNGGAAIPIPRTTATFYDGGDRLYVSGGTVTVTRASYSAGRTPLIAVQACAWEIYPVTPQLTAYILPFGENLAATMPDFKRVFVLIQATADNTTFQVDLNGDGTFDRLDVNFDGVTGVGEPDTITIQAGETFIIGPTGAAPQVGGTAYPDQGALATVNSNMLVQGSSTLQVKFIIGDQDETYETRGLSCFPRGYWSTDYYAPVGQPLVLTTRNTDIFLYNPHGSAISVNWETIAGSGTFSIGARDTVSYRAAVGSLPQGGAVYLSGSDVFWGVSTIDSTLPAYEWAYSLLPTSLLYREHYMGWAPGGHPGEQGTGGDSVVGNDSGVFLTVVQDGTTVFVDFNNDGVADKTYTLNRLQSQYIWDDTVGDTDGMTGARIWATGFFTMAFGQNPDTAPTQARSGDLGYVCIPGTDFIDIVMSVQKTVNPGTVPIASGSEAFFTLEVDSYTYPIHSGVTIEDTLPPNWEYVDDSTTITRPDLSTLSGNSADPTISGAGSILTWDTTQTDGPMAENRKIIITFTARTTEAFSEGDLSENRVKAIGSRTFGTPPETQVFTVSDFAMIAHTESSMSVTKTSDVNVAAFPGDTITYTVEIENTGSTDLNNVTIYDPLPMGGSYVPGSSSLARGTGNVRDEFASAAYNLNAGSEDWADNWTETDILGNGASGGLVSVTGGQLRFAYTNSTNTVRDEFSSVSYGNNNGTRNWSGDWTETDIPEYTGGPADGNVYITANTLRLRYVASNVRDDFTTASYSRNDGTLNWTDASWTETGDDGTATGGSIRVDQGGNDRVNFGPGAAGRSIQRTAPVSGTNVTVTYTLSDNGIDANEGIIAEYSLNGGTDWTEMLPRQNDNGVAGNTTIDTAGATSIILRFTTYGTWGGGDNAGLDAVNIAYLAAGSQVQRSVDLTGETSATLTFDFGRANLEASDDMVVEVSSDGSTFTTLATYDNGTATGGKSFDITSYISASTTIRFRVTNNLNNTDEYFSMDNVTITYNHGFIAANGSEIVRHVDLSTATSGEPITLSLDFNRNNLEAGDEMVVEVDGGSGFTVLETFTNLTAAGTKTYDITSYKSAATALRFRVTSGVDDTGEYFSIDNADISFSLATLPPNFLVTGDGYVLSAGSTLTFTYQVTVDDPFPTGRNEITNTVYVNSSEIKIPISASVTDPVVIPSAGTGEVGDLVWLDLNGDGIRDPGEPGLSNVQVTLKDLFGTPVASTFTDANGRYRFTGIAPGTGYYVEITGGLPAGLTQTAPSGRSDNRSNSFNLAAGQAYLDADLGYQSPAGTGTIGDFVWHDVNGDGVQDSGELGLAGVTVLLYRDADFDGVFEPGVDDGAPVATAVTGPDGSYLFTGITADDGTNTYDYFVYVDATQAALDGIYDYTTSPVTRVIDLQPDEARLSNDFGFELIAGSTYIYKDRVWFDANEDQQDTGESGIAGVTVNLLNASRQVVGTVTTDAAGYFTFSGLQGSTIYYIEISDTAGKLTDFYGTTAAALAGERQISNLTMDLDYTTGNAPWPNFGYTSRGAIGDFVWNDVDGDGVQDAGELGLSGVTVKLYNDVDGDGVIDAGVDLVVATVVTDANGNYIFSGLADGDYIVSIESPPAGYDFTGTDSDLVTAGAQLAVTITGGASNLDMDFGFRVPLAAQRSISGTLWHDLNNDGSDNGDFDGGSYLANVTVELLDSGGNQVGITTTDASGQYSFIGLADGTYTVRITDENNLLSGYNTTYEYTEGPKAGAYNGQEEVTLDNVNQDLVRNFGYYKPPVVTRAVIGEFGAFNEGGRVVVRWETLSEHGTLGFFLQRLNEKTGDYESVNAKLLPGLLYAPAGGAYTYEDRDARTGAYYTYRLEEVEAGGRRIIYGPWRVFTGAPPVGSETLQKLVPYPSISGFKRAEQSVSQDKIIRAAERLDARMTARAEILARRGGQIKIHIKEDGLYFIDAADIARVSEVNLNLVTRQIRTNRLRMHNLGQDVAVIPAADNSGIYFYGEERITTYSNENVYWLEPGNGLQMQKVNRAPGYPAEDFQYFYQWVREEENNYPLMTLFTDPNADFWMWDFIFPGFGYDQVTIPVSTPGIVDADVATLTVALQGASDVFDGDDHLAVVRVNGVEVGSVQWNGLSAKVMSVPVSAAILNDGDNLVEIEGIKQSGVDYNIFYVNNLQLVYPRRYASVDNHLTAESNGYRTIRMEGFTDPDIRVFDITNPRRPQVLTGTVIEPSAGAGNLLVRPLDGYTDSAIRAFDNAGTQGTGAIDNTDVEPVAVGGDYRVSFQNGNSWSSRNSGNILSRYLALTPEKIKNCTLVADQPSNLKTRVNIGNYLIITSGDMTAAAQALADYRASAGYVAKVVDVEDIYDEFAYGITDARAIRDFLAYAYANWRIPSEYVVLAGNGSFDYLDNRGFSDSIIPALLAGTPDGLIATDLPYSDVIGNDRVAEFAIGRIPVISADELLDYVNKVIGYESSTGEWTRRAMLAADASDAGGNFPADSEKMAALFPGNYLHDRLYLDVMPITDARADLVAGINAGRSYVNFIGHGGPRQIGKNNLFSTNDLGKLNNGVLLPVFTAMTCAAGSFGFPGIEGLSEALVLKPDGGAVAMWAPSGLAFNAESVELSRGFYSAVFIGGETVLGDAVRRSQENFANQGQKLYHLDMYNLMGDPALRLKHTLSRDSSW